MIVWLINMPVVPYGFSSLWVQIKLNSYKFFGIQLLDYRNNPLEEITTYLISLPKAMGKINPIVRPGSSNTLLQKQWEIWVI